MKPLAWDRYVPSEHQPWNLRRVVHLHRRAGFAATWAELRRDLHDGPAAAIQRMLTGTSRAAGVPGDFDHLARVIGDAAVAAGNAERLKAWWVYRILFSADPLTEKLTLMWHNHFATSNLKVEDVRLMRQQNELLRRYGRGKFGELLRSVVKHPAMLIWLDAQSNRKEHPNENLARELMELFTLGVGSYSEQDVQEAARALTGWTVSRGEFRFAEAYHDDNPKTILDHTGTFGGDELLDILLDQPAVARHLASRLSETFMGEGVVGETELAELADGLRARDLDIGWAVETVLRSQIFFSDDNIRSRVLSPVEYVAGTIRILEAFDPPPSTLLLAERIGSLGQDLFYPPNVFGWRGGRSWINTPSIIGRGNFVMDLLNGTLRSSPEPIDVTALAQRHGQDPSPESVLRFVGRLATGDLPDDTLTAAMQLIKSNRDGNGAPLRQSVASLLTSPDAQLG